MSETYGLLIVDNAGLIGARSTRKSQSCLTMRLTFSKSSLSSCLAPMANKARVGCSAEISSEGEASPLQDLRLLLHLRQVLRRVSAEARLKRISRRPQSRLPLPQEVRVKSELPTRRARVVRG